MGGEREGKRQEKGVRTTAKREEEGKGSSRLRRALASQLGGRKMTLGKLPKQDKPSLLSRAFLRPAKARLRGTKPAEKHRPGYQ